MNKENYERYYCNWERKRDGGMIKEIKGYIKKIERIRKEDRRDGNGGRNKTMTIDRSPYRRKEEHRQNKTIDYCNKTPERVRKYKDCSPIKPRTPDNSHSNSKRNFNKKMTPTRTPNGSNKMKNKYYSHTRDKSYNCSTPTKKNNMTMRNHKIPKPKSRSNISNTINTINTTYTYTNSNTNKTLPSTGKKPNNNNKIQSRPSKGKSQKKPMPPLPLPYNQTQDYPNELIFQSFGKPLCSPYPHHNDTIEQDHLHNRNPSTKTKRPITPNIKAKTNKLNKQTTKAIKHNQSAKNILNNQPINTDTTVRNKHQLPDEIHHIDFNELDQFSPPNTTTQLNYHHPYTYTQYKNTVNYQKHIYWNTQRK